MTCANDDAPLPFDPLPELETRATSRAKPAPNLRHQWRNPRRIAEGAPAHTHAELEFSSTTSLKREEKERAHTHERTRTHEVQTHTDTPDITRTAHAFLNAFSDGFPLSAMPTDTARWWKTALKMARAEHLRPGTFSVETIKSKTLTMLNTRKPDADMHLWDVMDALDKERLNAAQSESRTLDFDPANVIRMEVDTYVPSIYRKPTPETAVSSVG